VRITWASGTEHWARARAELSSHKVKAYKTEPNKALISACLLPNFSCQPWRWQLVAPHRQATWWPFPWRMEVSFFPVFDVISGWGHAAQWQVTCDKLDARQTLCHWATPPP
jgi:hypothetical protein